MSCLRGFLLSLLAFTLPLRCAEAPSVLKSSQVDALFARAPQEMAVPGSSCCAIRFQVLDGKQGPNEANAAADRLIFVRRGRATVLVGGKRRVEAGENDLINLPRGTSYQVDPVKGRLETIEVLVYPRLEGRPPRFGALVPMGDVLHKADMDALYAKFDTEQPVYVTPHFRVAFVIRNTPSAFESHGCCTDIYLPMHAGSAHLLLGGTIENPQEGTPGEVRGSALPGSQPYELAIGDMVVIPRAGTHYVDPRPGKIGYLIVKVETD